MEFGQIDFPFIFGRDKGHCYCICTYEKAPNVTEEWADLFITVIKCPDRLYLTTGIYSFYKTP